MSTKTKASKAKTEKTAPAEKAETDRISKTDVKAERQNAGIKRLGELHKPLNEAVAAFEKSPSAKTVQALKEASDAFKKTVNSLSTQF